MSSAASANLFPSAEELLLLETEMDAAYFKDAQNGGGERTTSRQSLRGSASRVKAPDLASVRSTPEEKYRGRIAGARCAAAVAIRNYLPLDHPGRNTMTGPRLVAFAAKKIGRTPESAADWGEFLLAIGDTEQGTYYANLSNRIEDYA